MSRRPEPMERRVSDGFRRTWEEQERLRRLTDPLGDLRRRMDPLGDAYKQLGLGSATLEFLRQEEERRKLMAGIADLGGVGKIAADAARQRKLLEGPIKEARRLGLFDPTSDLRKSMATAMTARQEYERLFRLPEVDEIGRFAREAVASTRLASAVLRDQAALQIAMAGVRSPWLRIEEASASARAFSDLVAIGRGIDARLSFDAAYVEALRPSLGDWRDEATPAAEPLVDPLLRPGLYYERGLDPALTDFTPPALEESLRLAGLREDGEDAHQQDDQGFERAGAAFEQLRRFEIAIRRFIKQVMHEAYGDDWMKRQLPANMLDRWNDKRDAAINAGEPEQPLIDYADFTDDRALIERKDNWNAVFKPVFGRAEDVRESFQRLFPVRIATMHARLVTLDDELLLRVETRRVLKAIGNLIGVHRGEGSGPGACRCLCWKLYVSPRAVTVGVAAALAKDFRPTSFDLWRPHFHSAARDEQRVSIRPG